MDPAAAAAAEAKLALLINYLQHQRTIADVSSFPSLQILRAGLTCFHKVLLQCESRNSRRFLPLMLFLVVSPAIMVYDWLLCLSDEVELVWFSPWSYVHCTLWLRCHLLTIG